MILQLTLEEVTVEGALIPIPSKSPTSRCGQTPNRCLLGTLDSSPSSAVASSGRDNMSEGVGTFKCFVWPACYQIFLTEQQLRAAFCWFAVRLGHFGRRP